MGQGKVAPGRVRLKIREHGARNILRSDHNAPDGECGMRAKDFALAGVIAASGYAKIEVPV